MATFEEQYEHMIKKQLAEMLEKYQVAQQEAASLLEQKSKQTSPDGKELDKSTLQVDKPTTLDEARMQVVLPRGYQNIVRPGQAPKQTLTQ